MHEGRASLREDKKRCQEGLRGLERTWPFSSLCERVLLLSSGPSRRTQRYEIIRDTVNIVRVDAVSLVSERTELIRTIRRL